MCAAADKCFLCHSLAANHRVCVCAYMSVSVGKFMHVCSFLIYGCWSSSMIMHVSGVPLCILRVFRRGCSAWLWTRTQTWQWMWSICCCWSISEGFLCLWWFLSDTICNVQCRHFIVADLNIPNILYVTGTLWCAFRALFALYHISSYPQCWFTALRFCVKSLNEKIFRSVIIIWNLRSHSQTKFTWK